MPLLIFKESEATTVAANTRLENFIRASVAENGKIPASAEANIRDAGNKLIQLADFIQANGTVYIKEI